MTSSELKLLRSVEPDADQSWLEDFSVDPGGAAPDVDRPESLQLVRAATRPPLFDYQTELSTGFANLALKRMPGLISLPTGGGKTLVASFGIMQYLTQRPTARILWLAPTRELLDQAFDSLQRVWRETGTAPDVTLSFTETPLDPSIALLTPHMTPTRAYDVVVFDEAHHLAAPTFKAVVSQVAKRANASVIGLSATPGRTDPEELYLLLQLFERRLVTSPALGRNPVKNLQQRGVLSHLKFKLLGEVDPASIGDADRLRIIAEISDRLASRHRKVLVFNRSVQHAKVTAALLKGRGVSAQYVEGNLPPAERRSRLARFSQGRVQVLTNQKLLTAGYDAPGITDIVIERPTNSAIQFEQMVGRVARGPRTGGTAIGHVWQFEDHLALHGLPQSYHRYNDEGWERCQPDDLSS